MPTLKLLVKSMPPTSANDGQFCETELISHRFVVVMIECFPVGSRTECCQLFDWNFVASSFTWLGG